MAPGPDEWLVLSLWQPYATALTTGVKTIETRAWKTSYRGRLYIHATKKFPAHSREFAAEQYACGRLPTLALPLGCLLGSVHLVDVRPASELVDTVSMVELLYGDFAPGRWGWLLRDPRPFAEPIPAAGMQGLWRYKPAIGTR